MGYYNLFYILRNIVFNFRKIFKYISISFLSILFIAICLLLISSNKVSAETLIANGSAFQEYECQNFQNYYEQNMASTYDYYCAVLRAGDSYAYINFFNASTDFNVHWTTENNGFVRSWPNNAISSGVWYSVQVRSLNDATYTYQGSFSGALSNWCTRIGSSPNFQYYFFGNIPLYDGADNLVWEPINNIPPTIENFNNQNVVSSMVAGEYFDIVVIANDYANTQIVFHINNGDLPIESEDKYKYIILDSNSPYLLPTSEGSLAQGWKIPKSALIPIYDNCTYNMWLNYGENFALSTETETLITSFSALGKEMAITDTQDATQDINNFLRDNSFNNSSIVNNMPSNNVPDPTADQINNIFNMFRNTFSTENAQDVVFQVPHSNETITIPANLVTSHMPQPLLILIQSFYWFLICRFIVKDISKIVEHAKSGEILDATDGNIKTDLL